MVFSTVIIIGLAISGRETVVLDSAGAAAAVSVSMSLSIALAQQGNYERFCGRLE